MSDERRKMIEEECDRSSLLPFSQERRLFRLGAEWADSHSQTTGDDERDAEEWTDKHKGCFATNASNRYEGFLAGRKGMVPKSLYDHAVKNYIGLNDRLIHAEALLNEKNTAIDILHVRIAEAEKAATLEGGGE